MRIGTKQRREADAARVEAIKAQMYSLETRLAATRAGRASQFDALRAWAAAAVDEARRRWAARLASRSAATTRRLDALRAKLAAMRARFDGDFEAVPADIEARGSELAERLLASMDNLNRESLSRLDREAAIVKRLANHESDVASKFDASRSDRESAYVALTARLEDHVDRKQKHDEITNSAIEANTAALHNAITREAKTRWREDTEIAEAMRTYIDKLQLSLHVVNSDAIE